MGNRTLQQAFVGGEIAPSLLARSDDGAYKAGAALMQNFVALPQGAARSRPGFRYVGEADDSNRAVRLIPFRFSASQNLVLVLSHYLLRVISNGGFLVNGGGDVYSVATQYAASDLAGLDYTQNGDVVTFTSPNYPPTELRRYGNTDWRFAVISTAPSISAPSSYGAYGWWASSLTSAEQAQKNRITATYMVTALDSDLVESAPTPAFSGTGNYYLDGCGIRVWWGAVSGARYYRVYRSVAGVYGFIGQTDTLYIDDIGNNPDTTSTPPKYDVPFSGQQGTILSVTVAAGGSGYQGHTDPLSATISVSDGSASGAVLSPVFTDGALTSVTITSGGSGYASPTATLTANHGSGAEISLTATDGVITAATVDAGGSGYADEVTPLSFSIAVVDRQAAGSGAVVSATISGGVIVAVSVTEGGSGYVEPYIEVTSNYGSGASFTISYNSVGNNVYPSACGYFDQRRVFAGSYAKPLKVWFTNAGQENLMMYHLPVLADDRISITAVTSGADRIRHVISLDSLILFTAACELKVFTQNSDALTPDSVAVRVQSYVGASHVQPQLLNAMIVYAGARGGHVRGMGYDYSAQGYISGDISLRAAHLFDNEEILDLTISKAPVQIVWCASSSGLLLGCTYYPEQQVVAWHRHVLQGAVESVCAVSEGEEDHLYVVLSDGNGRRWVERMADLAVPESAASCRNLDSYLDATFSTPQSSVSGLEHLAGQEVAVLADGVRQANATVSAGGVVTLETAACEVVVGKEYTSRIVTVPLIAQAEASLQGRLKNVSELKLRVSHGGDVYIGSYPGGTMWKCKAEDKYMQPQDDESFFVRATLDGGWTESGQVAVERRGALPLELAAIVANMNAEE